MRGCVSKEIRVHPRSTSPTVTSAQVFDLIAGGASYGPRVGVRKAKANGQKLSRVPKLIRREQPSPRAGVK